MEIVLWIVGVIAAAIIVLLLVAAMKPDMFEAESRAFMNAPPEKVYALIEDFRAWSLWSPWEKMEAEGDLVRTFSGAERGLGARYAWNGKKTGQGEMEINEARPGERLSLRLQFIKPFAALNTTDFVLTPMDGGTEVSWSMRGPQPFMFKVMGTLFNSKKMIAKQFGQGLADMKAAAEAA